MSRFHVAAPVGKDNEEDRWNHEKKADDVPNERRELNWNCEQIKIKERTRK